MLFSGSFKKTKGSLIEWEEADTHQTAPQPKKNAIIMLTFGHFGY